jgi:Ca2+-binding RTX toxin-like protein
VTHRTRRIVSQPFHALEPRRLLAASLSSTGLLDVLGAAAAETISVSLSGTNVVVKINNATQTFPLAKVKSLRVNAGAGNDRVTVAANLPAATLNGGDGNDTLTGGSRNDTLNGNNGNDSLLGGAGNDTLIGGPGNDTLSGQGNFDSADYRSSLGGVRLSLDGVANDGQVSINERDNLLDAEQLLGSNFNDTITGNGGTNQIFGGAGNDEIRALAGNDSVYGGPGNDKLFGGDGNDTLKGDDGNDLLGGENGDDSMDGGNGADGIYGNAGKDTLDYSARTANLVITIDGKANDGQLNEQDNVSWDVEVIKGGKANDSITAEQTRFIQNTFIGGPGNDTLDGGAGEDTLDGGDGNDLLRAGRGDEESISLQSNPPVDHSKVAPNSLLGGAGNDTLVPGQHDDILSGGAGNDTADYSGIFSGFSGGIKVSLDGVRNDGFGEFILDLPIGEGPFVHSEADNVLPDVETVIAGAGNDLIVGSSANNVLIGGAGNDTIRGQQGNDTIKGDAGDDSLDGGDGDDWFDGGAGGDIITGGESAGANWGKDTLDYSARTANLNINTTDDQANDGEAGERDNIAWDVDLIKCGKGNDHVVARANVSGGDGNDTLEGVWGGNTFDGGAGNDVLRAKEDDDVYWIDDPTPHVGTTPSILLGGAGDDRLVAGRGDNVLSGGPGNDTADYSEYGSYTGVDISLDGVRNDGYRPWSMYFLGTGQVYYSESDNVMADVENVIGSWNWDNITGNGANNRLEGGGGNDVLNGGGGNDTLVGDRQNVSQYDSDQDTLNGGDGDDTLLSRDAFADVLDGGNGFDRAQIDEKDTRSNIEQLLA